MFSNTGSGGQAADTAFHWLAAAGTLPRCRHGSLADAQAARCAQLLTQAAVARPRALLPTGCCRHGPQLHA
eukprot:4807282-Alexandrium_andersonii.AAC.1